MTRDPKAAIDAIVGFARLISDAGTASPIFEFLAESLVGTAGADGVAVIDIDASGIARFAVVRGLPDPVRAVALDADAIGEELGEAILRAAGTDYTSEQTRPLVADGNLFGAVVMLYLRDHMPTPGELNLAGGLVDLASISLESALQRERLVASNEALRAAQDTLARTEKLRALGQMAAGVSHDLKNILNPLSLHLQVMDRALAKGNIDDARASIPEMKQVVVRGVENVERLRSYSRQAPESRTELVELDRLLREAAQIAKPRMAVVGARRVLELHEELTNPPRVIASGGEIVSAFVNLIVNAIDACAAEGKAITLRSGEADGGSWVEVADDGPGMPPEVEKRVFEPFFTTKGAEGTGLGLAMVYATMQRHGGTLTLMTAPGKGTRFRLWFPGAPPSK